MTFGIKRIVALGALTVLCSLDITSAMKPCPPGGYRLRRNRRRLVVDDDQMKETLGDMVNKAWTDDPLTPVHKTSIVERLLNIGKMSVASKKVCFEKTDTPDEELIKNCAKRFLEKENQFEWTKGYLLEDGIYSSCEITAQNWFEAGWVKEDYSKKMCHDLYVGYYKFLKVRRNELGYSADDTCPNGFVAPFLKYDFSVYVLQSVNPSIRGNTQDGEGRLHKVIRSKNTANKASIKPFGEFARFFEDRFCQTEIGKHDQNTAPANFDAIIIPLWKEFIEEKLSDIRDTLEKLGVNYSWWDQQKCCRSAPQYKYGDDLERDVFHTILSYIPLADIKYALSIINNFIAKNKTDSYRKKFIEKWSGIWPKIAGAKLMEMKKIVLKNELGSFKEVNACESCWGSGIGFDGESTCPCCEGDGLSTYEYGNRR